MSNVCDFPLIKVISKRDVILFYQVIIQQTTV